jgi:hypothetical protein
MTLPVRRPARWDTCVPLSPTRIPLVVLQDRLCSVHAAEALSGDWRRLCDVKVKLTKRLAVGAGLLGSAHSIARRFSKGSGEIVTQGGVKQSLVVAREGWMSPLTLARKDQHRRGRAFSEPSLFLGSRNPVTGAFEKAVGSLSPPDNGIPRDVIQRSHSPDIRYAGPMRGVGL